MLIGVVYFDPDWSIILAWGYRSELCWDVERNNIRRKDNFKKPELAHRIRCVKRVLGCSLCTYIRAIYCLCWRREVSVASAEGASIGTILINSIFNSQRVWKAALTTLWILKCWPECDKIQSIKQFNFSSEVDIRSIRKSKSFWQILR